MNDASGRRLDRDPEHEHDPEPDRDVERDRDRQPEPPDATPTLPDPATPKTRRLALD
jgi:hypothetical protein